MIFVKPFAELPAEFITIFLIIKGWLVQKLQPRLEQFQPHFLEVLIGFANRSPAPAKTPEGADKAIFRAQPTKVGQVFGHTGIHDIVERRGADERSPRFPEFLDGCARGGGPQLQYFTLYADRPDPFSYRIGHQRGALPHGIVNDRRPQPRLSLGHIPVERENPLRVGWPDLAMVGR